MGLYRGWICICSGCSRGCRNCLLVCLILFRFRFGCGMCCMLWVCVMYCCG